MSTQDLRGRKSTLLQRYQRNAESQDPLNQPMNTAPMSKSTSQRSLQNSTLLQRRYSKTTSQDLPQEPPASAQQPSKTSSQRSLDQSKLLQRYYKQNSLDSQDPPKPEPQQYSSQKNLENSKLLQRYGGPQTNHSQEFTGLAPRESTPVARFQRSGSLEPEKMVRPSLLSRYTPRFGQSLDRNKVVGAGGYSNYSSQHSLDQNMSQSQTFADYGSDHFDQYDSRNLRSRSSSMARGLNSRSMQRELGPPAPMNVDMEKENVPMEPITPETLPVVATTEPVMGVVSSALPMPMLGVIPPTPMVEASKPTLEIDTNKLQPRAPSPIPTPQQAPPIVPAAEPEKPKRKEPVKPPRKDLAASATHLFNAEVPLAREESFTTPLPTPRRSRSRSQISKAFDDDRTSRGAESYIFGAVDSAMVKHSMDLSESNGYATVRKDPPPRPPAPIRRRRSTRSLGDQRQFSTLPNFHSVSPQRPSRNYSTINPNRPPRMKSNTNLDDGAMRSASVSKNDFTEYEDIEQMEQQARMHQALETGAVLNKMKDRPLPPPPRPPRDHKKPKKPDHDDRLDYDGGAERIVAIQPFERVEEVEIAIQTDPLPEDYELDIEVEEALGGVLEEEPTKTLQEILKEEQQAEIARARQLAEASSLMRDIQKFRESTSSLSQQGSRPETPAASILERRVSVPTASSMRSEVRPLSNENLSEQDLAHAEDDKYIAELVKKYVSEEKVTPTESAKRQPKATPAPQPAQEVDAEKLREIEAMIVSEQVEREEFRVVQSEPAAPPRRRSLVASSQDLSRSVEISPNVIEEIVERLRTNEQQHIAELQQLQQQQLEDLKKQHEEQQRLHDQKLEEQQKQLMEQQNQQLQETQQLKEQIQQQQEQQKALLQQLQQQEKEREQAREVAQQRAKELEQQRMLELQQQQLILQQQEKEREHARELEQQLAKELEQQRIRETQRIHELEMQRAREAELLRAKEAELLRAKEAELLRAKEAEMLRAMEAEMLRAREADLLRAREAELLKAKANEPKEEAEPAVSKQTKTQPAVETTPVTISETPEVSIEVSEETAAKEAPPARPPPPRISPQPPMPAQFPYQEYLPYSLPQQPFYPGRNYSDDEGGLPQAPQRRRRHHRSRRESTSEEEFQRDQRKQRHGTRSPEPSIPTLGGQLIRACGASIRETGDELMTILRASSKDENKRDLHIALIILIVIVAGLMALGMSAERDVHHHHWDYFNPPGNGRV